MSQYGDKTLIPREYLESAVEFINQTRSLVTWKQGDVILIDVGLPCSGRLYNRSTDKWQNHAVQHAREPWTGERKLLASLWDAPQAV